MLQQGNDEELTVGLLAGEAIARRAADVRLAEHCGPPSPDKGIRNIICRTHCCLIRRAQPHGKAWLRATTPSPSKPCYIIGPH